MKDNTHPSYDEEIRVGFTATGNSKHILDDWTKPSRVGGTGRSVCNILVRDFDTMVEQFGIQEDTAEEMWEQDWCGKCHKWLKNMRYLQSRNTLTAVPAWVVDAWSEEFGYDDRELASVTILADWKKKHHRA